ncbi:MAG: hypothetical protein ACK4WH_12765 [Phycisphaerales bacterium]
MSTMSGPPTPETSRAFTRLVEIVLAVHADSAGQADEQRKSRIGLLIERQVAGLDPTSRTDTLRRFSALLSDAQSGLRAAAGAVDADVRSDAGATDADAIVGRLITLVPSLTPAQRAVTARRLRDSGLGQPGSATDLPGAGSAALAAALHGAGPKSAGLDAIDTQRALDAAALLVEFVASLDQLVWNTWKAVSPDSSFKRGVPIRSVLAGFVSSEGSVQHAAVRSDLERLRRLTAALTAAVGQAGRQYAQRHQQRFAPVEIERAVRDEGGWNAEARCWEKYRKLAAANDVEAMQSELMSAVAAFAEALLRGTTGPAGSIGDGATLGQGHSGQGDGGARG